MLEGGPTERMCGEKVRFNARDAELRAQALGMRAYQCPLCDGHHLSSHGVPWTRRTRAIRKKAQQRAGRSRRKGRE